MVLSTVVTLMEKDPQRSWAQTVGEGPSVRPSWAAGSLTTVQGAEGIQHLWKAGTDVSVPLISSLENGYYLSFLRLS